MARVKKNVVVKGMKTSVKLRADLYDRFVAKAGSSVDKLLQGFANDAPADHPNRSAWVEEQITHHLVLSELPPMAKSQH